MKTDQNSLILSPAETVPHESEERTPIAKVEAAPAGNPILAMQAVPLPKFGFDKSVP